MRLKYLMDTNWRRPAVLRSPTPKIVVIELWIKWITRPAISYATKCRKIADRIH